MRLLHGSRIFFMPPSRFTDHGATMDDPFACPHCGAAIDQDAVFCRHCGSSDEDGWAENLDEMYVDDDFQYDEFIRENFSDRRTDTNTRPLWRIVALVLLGLFALGFMMI